MAQPEWGVVQTSRTGLPEERGGTVRRTGRPGRSRKLSTTSTSYYYNESESDVPGRIGRKSGGTEVFVRSVQTRQEIYSAQMPSGTRSERALCRDFIKGRCSRRSCRFSHVSRPMSRQGRSAFRAETPEDLPNGSNSQRPSFQPPSRPPSTPTSRPPSRATSRAKYRPSSRPPSRFGHRPPSRSAPRCAERNGYGAETESRPSSRQSSRYAAAGPSSRPTTPGLGAAPPPEARKTRQCYRYLQNTCRFGAGCHHAHIRGCDAEQVLARLRQKLDCPFQEGTACKYGSSCDFKHPQPEAAAVPEGVLVDLVDLGVADDESGEIEGN